MKAVVFLMCFVGYTAAAPAPESGSQEQQIAAHAHTALQLMELYRLYGHLQHQVQAQPAQAPQPGFLVNHPALHPREDDSDEEAQPQHVGAFYPPYGYPAVPGAPAVPAAPATPPNSDEAEEAEGAEAAEAEGAEAAEAEAEPVSEAPVTDLAPAATAVDPVVVDPPVEVEVGIEVPIAADIPATDVLNAAAAAAAAVDPALVPQGAPVAVEIDATFVEPDTHFH
ncbi:hypothetical protein AOLI_G00191650 [Acnodon oligacanthus]